MPKFHGKAIAARSPTAGHTLKSSKTLLLTEKALASVSVVKRKNQKNKREKLSTSERVTGSSNKRIKTERPENIVKTIFVHHQRSITSSQR